MTLFFIILALVLGYGFGKLTCSEHISGKRGLFMTISIIILINLIHSMIDGLIVHQYEKFSAVIITVMHELIRQPFMYVVVAMTLFPFTKTWWVRFGLSFIIVTIVWIFGLVIGYYGSVTIHGDDKVNQIIHEISHYGIYFIIGDGLHHLLDVIKSSFVKHLKTH
jgi:hypothetical protein